MSEKAKLLRRASKALKEGLTPSPEVHSSNKGNFDMIVSTGSTLLDLAISGGVTKSGGFPVGILVEIFGASGSGKSAILSEMAGNVQKAGGSLSVLDPEGRLDHEHAKIYGLHLSEGTYHMPDTVTEVFEHINDWEPENEVGPNMVMTDSLAALSTDMEMKEDDAMGMRRAKEFSQGLRKVCRKIKTNNWLIACSNQVRVNMKTGGVSTPGGMGIPFYCSVRIQLTPSFKNKYLKKVVTINGVKQEKIYGIKTECKVIKSSIDDPFRTAYFYLIFDYGVDDLRANLEYLKENSSETSYTFPNFSCKTLNKAIEYAEENDLEDEVKERVISLWHEIQNQLRITRKSKRR
jgi:RecA/RadA recombinase